MDQFEPGFVAVTVSYRFVHLLFTGLKQRIDSQSEGVSQQRLDEFTLWCGKSAQAWIFIDLNQINLQFFINHEVQPDQLKRNFLVFFYYFWRCCLKDKQCFLLELTEYHLE